MLKWVQQKGNKGEKNDESRNEYRNGKNIK